MNSDMIELMNNMRRLTPEERNQAKDAATKEVSQRAKPRYPREPKTEDFKINRVQKYPQQAIIMQFMILGCILLFGFLPSAMRVFSYGSELFSHVIQNPWASGVAGVSLVIMAEASVIGFSLARLFTPDPDEGDWISVRSMFSLGVVCPGFANPREQQNRI